MTEFVIACRILFVWFEDNKKRRLCKPAFHEKYLHRVNDLVKRVVYPSLFLDTQANCRPDHLQIRSDDLLRHADYLVMFLLFGYWTRK